MRYRVAVLAFALALPAAAEEKKLSGAAITALLPAITAGKRTKNRIEPK